MIDSVAAELERAKRAVDTMTEAAAVARAPFEWADGPLVTAMRQGDIILIDELNLAEDAVLERLNRSMPCIKAILRSTDTGPNCVLQFVQASSALVKMLSWKSSTANFAALTRLFWLPECCRV